MLAEMAASVATILASAREYPRQNIGPGIRACLRKRFFVEASLFGGSESSAPICPRKRFIQPALQARIVFQHLIECDPLVFNRDDPASRAALRLVVPF